MRIEDGNDALCVIDDRIGWILDNGDVVGAILGDDNQDAAYYRSGIDEGDRGDRIHCLANLVCCESKIHRDFVGFRFDSESEANRMMSMIVARWSAHESGNSTEPWEEKALAAGWKPPKNWRK
jgi:hypothetical protein